MNFAPAVPLANIKKVCELEGRSSLDMFELTDYLILNEVEVEELSESPINKESINEDAKRASKVLLEKFKIGKGVIVTLGESGVLFTPAGDAGDSTHVKGRQVKVVDTTVSFKDTDLI